MYQITKTKLQGCLELIPHIFQDVRGITVKPFCVSALKEVGINNIFEEDLLVASNKNVIRGMHFQKQPFGQAKLVYCIKGRIKDVVLDIRKGSPTYGKYEVIELTEEKKNMLYIPEGFAHGYMALEDNSIMFYKMSHEYNKEAEDGIRWDSFGMEWECENAILSDRDKQFQTFDTFLSPFVYEDK